MSLSLHRTFKLYYFIYKKGDGWLLDLNNFQWTRINTHFETRLWHTAINANQDNQIYVFGGSLTDVYGSQPVFPKHMLKITLTPESLKS